MPAGGGVGLPQDNVAVGAVCKGRVAQVNVEIDGIGIVKLPRSVLHRHSRLIALPAGIAATVPIGVHDPGDVTGLSVIVKGRRARPGSGG